MNTRRKKLVHYENNLQPRFLTFSCFERLPLLANPKIAETAARYLERARVRHRFRLIAWVLMPEHVHILIIPRPRVVKGIVVTSISAPLSSIKRPFATHVLKRWRELGWSGLAKLRDSCGKLHFWNPGPGFDRNIRDAEEFADTIRYIHANPVKRGLVSIDTDYRWSSARSYAGTEDHLVHVDRVRYGAAWNWRDPNE